MRLDRYRFFEMCFVLAVSAVCAMPVLAVATWFLLPFDW